MADTLTNGYGGTTGDSLVTRKPIVQSGSTYYVDVTTGNAAYTGLDRKMPLAALSAAVAAASAGDTIIMLDGHTETISAALAISAQLTIIGEGSSSGVPTVILTLNHATADIFTVSAHNCQFRNIKIAVPAQATTGSMFTLSGDGGLLDNVHIDVNDENNANAVAFAAGANHWFFRNCTFTSAETDTTSTAKPYPPILIGGDISGLRMEGCVLDGGAEGFEDGSSNNWALDGSAFDITSGMAIENLSLLRGAIVKLKGTSTVGYINVQTSSGSAGVYW